LGNAPRGAHDGRPRYQKTLGHVRPQSSVCASDEDYFVFHKIKNIPARYLSMPGRGIVLAMQQD
jgi:hypothetical protein